MDDALMPLAVRLPPAVGAIDHMEAWRLLQRLELGAGGEEVDADMAALLVPFRGAQNPARRWSTELGEALALAETLLPNVDFLIFSASAEGGDRLRVFTSRLSGQEDVPPLSERSLALDAVGVEDGRAALELLCCLLETILALQEMSAEINRGA